MDFLVSAFVVMFVGSAGFIATLALTRATQAPAQ